MHWINWLIVIVLLPRMVAAAHVAAIGRAASWAFSRPNRSTGRYLLTIASGMPVLAIDIAAHVGDIGEICIGRRRGACWVEASRPLYWPRSPRFMPGISSARRALLV